jgi:hypothetical protein
MTVIRGTRRDGTGGAEGGVLPSVQRGGTGVRPGTGQRPRAQTRGTATPEHHRALRVAGLALLAAYLGFMAWWALRPDTAAWMRDTNLTPFATVRADLTGGATGYLALLRNLLIAAPLGVLLPMAGGRIDVSPLGSLLHTAGGGILLATAQEVLETAGAGKVLDVDDILLAFLGIVLAHATVVPAARAALRRHRRNRALPAGAHLARNSHSDFSAA